MGNTQLNLSLTKQLHKSLLIVLIALCANARSAFCQTNTTWKGGAGNWNDATKWTNGVPNGNFNAFIDGGNALASSVALNVNQSINNLAISSGDSLGFNNGTVLTVNGSSISNAGSITLNSSANLTELVIGSSAVTLSGGGTLTMSNNANNFIFGAASGDTLVNQETIQGAGNIGAGQMTLVNSGTINANQAAGLTIQASGGAVNTGTIKATAGTLALKNTIMTNTGGTITSSGQNLQVNNSAIIGGTVTLTGAATLQLSGGTIHSGTLNNSATGTIEVLSSTANTLGGTITNPAGGVLKIDNAARLNLANGAYPNLGTVTLNSTGNVTDLVVDGGNITLSGGTVTLSNNANNRIYGSTSADVLTNQETIQGAGNIGAGQMTLVNSGTIAANQSAGLTIQANGGTLNTGTITATAGTLALVNTTVSNLGGTISTSGQTLKLTNSTINGGTVTLTGAATVQLSNSTIQGGTLNNSTTGTIEVLSSTANALGGTITNPAGGVLKIDNAARLNLVNGAYPNLGAVTLNSTGNVTDLVLGGGNVTLSGGTVTMSNNANNRIYGSTSADVLTNQETIQGSGNIGAGQMTLVNSGTIAANQSAGLTIQANGGTLNTGTITATAGTLALVNTTVSNLGGTISSSGQTLKLTNSTINGGTVTLTGAATLQLSGGTIQGGTLNNSTTGTIEVLSSTANTLGGTITNPAGGVLKIDNAARLNLANGAYPNLGAVSLNSTGNLTDLVIAGGNVTLSGGTVTMSNNANNRIYGSTSANTLTNQETIQGAGNIGAGQMTLVNSGTINANQSAGLTIQANGGTLNTGTIKATAGTLALVSTTVSNLGGTISSSGQTLKLTNSTINGGTVTLTGAATLQMSNSTIQGGTLSNSTTGTIEVLSSTANTLGGTISNPAGGVLKIDNAARLNLVNGSYSNAGSLTLNSTGNFTDLVVGGSSVILTGGGTVTMSNNANNRIYGAASTDILTNQETIQGSGNIGVNLMGLVNSGTIIANQSTPLIIQPNSMGFTNNGTLQVNSGDIMHVETGRFTNFVGTTLTGGTYNVSGTLEIDQLGSTGGEIVTNAAKISLNGTTSSFIDAGAKDALSNLASNATGSSFTITGGRNFTTAGNFTNNGTLTVGSSTSKFTVNGNLSNFSGTTLTGGAYNLTGTLQFNGANIVTNAANITLTGTSSQILNQTAGNGLANFATNASTGSFTINSGRTFTTAGNFTNSGALAVGSSTSKFTVNGNLSNFSGTTLTGGIYNLTGTLQFNGANIVTNAANITLTGTSSQILNQTAGNGLANFATNASSGKFTVAGGRVFTTAGAFINNGSLTTTGSGSGFTTGGAYTNTGTLTIGSSSVFTVGGTGAFTQTAGTTTDDGTLTLLSSGTLSLNGGSLFGTGTITGAVKSSGTVSPGDSTAATGILKDTGAYTQNSTGILNIAIAGTTAGTQYDQLNPTTASLGGTLNISRPTGFTPSLGSTFKILNFTSETGTFSTVNGLAINSTEHFTITYQPTDVLLTVVSGAAAIASPAASSRPSLFGYTSSARVSDRFELSGRGSLNNLLPHLSRPVSTLAALASPRVSESFLRSRAPSGSLIATARSRSLADYLSSIKFTAATATSLGTRATSSGWSIAGFGRQQTYPRADLGWSVMRAAKLASLDYAGRQNGLNRMAALVPARHVSTGRAQASVLGVAANGANQTSMNPAGTPLPTNGRTPGMNAPRSLEYQLDVFSIVRMGPRQAWRELWRQSRNPYAPALAYLTLSGIR